MSIKNPICDICEEEITDDMFKVVIIHNADKTDLENECFSEGKQLIGHTACIENMNFRKQHKEEAKEYEKVSDCCAAPYDGDIKRCPNCNDNCDYVEIEK